MNCPRCNILMQTTDRTGIDIEVCPECRGVFLDRGELDKIIERSGVRYSNPEYVHSAHDENRGWTETDGGRPFGRRHDDVPGQEKQHKRGFLRDLFDF